MTSNIFSSLKMLIRLGGLQFTVSSLNVAARLAKLCFAVGLLRGAGNLLRTQVLPAQGQGQFTCRSLLPAKVLPFVFPTLVAAEAHVTMLGVDVANGVLRRLGLSVFIFAISLLRKLWMRLPRLKTLPLPTPTALLGSVVEAPARKALPSARWWQIQRQHLDEPSASFAHLQPRGPQVSPDPGGQPGQWTCGFCFQGLPPMPRRTWRAPATRHLRQCHAGASLAASSLALCKRRSCFVADGNRASTCRS